MITISAFKNREEALISQALLEAAGVPVTLKGENDRLQLQVRDSDAKIAQEILVGAEAPGWSRRTGVSGGGLGKSRPGVQMALCFIRGGSWSVGFALLALLILLPFGLRIPLTPFPLLFLFILGGCGSVAKRYFRVRRRYRARRRLL